MTEKDLMLRAYDFLFYNVMNYAAVTKADAAITGDDAEAHLNVTQFVTSFPKMGPTYNVAFTRAATNWVVAPMYYNGFVLGESELHSFLAAMTGTLWVATNDPEVEIMPHEVMTVTLPDMVWLHPQVPEFWLTNNPRVKEVR